MDRNGRTVLVEDSDVPSLCESSQEGWTTEQKGWILGCIMMFFITCFVVIVLLLLLNLTEGESGGDTSSLYLFVIVVIVSLSSCLCAL